MSCNQTEKKVTKISEVIAVKIAKEKSRYYEIGCDEGLGTLKELFEQAHIEYWAKRKQK